MNIDVADNLLIRYIFQDFSKNILDKFLFTGIKFYFFVSQIRYTECLSTVGKYTVSLTDWN